MLLKPLSGHTGNIQTRHSCSGFSYLAFSNYLSTWCPIIPSKMCSKVLFYCSLWKCFLLTCWTANMLLVLDVYNRFYQGASTQLHMFSTLSCVFLPASFFYFFSLNLAVYSVYLKTPQANSTEGPANVSRQYHPLDIPKTLTFCQQLDIHIDAILYFY